jgi:RimJ/RimL family protein N-acetyltransferase
MIYGDRIRFRHAERSDIPTFVGWLNDPEVRQGISIYLPMSQAEEENWFENLNKRPPDERVLCIEVRQPAGESHLENWRLIGNCSFFEIDWRNRSAEFGIMIGEKSFWNQGYGSEAVRLLLKLGFETLNLQRIFLRVFETNPRAIRAYEKAGFTLEGRQRKAEFQNGKYIDVLVMSILAEEWRAQNA